MILETYLTHYRSHHKQLKRTFNAVTQCHLLESNYLNEYQNLFTVKRQKTKILDSGLFPNKSIYISKTTSRKDVLSKDCRTISSLKRPSEIQSSKKLCFWVIVGNLPNLENQGDSKTQVIFKVTILGTNASRILSQRKTPFSSKFKMPKLDKYLSYRYIV